MKFIKKLSIFVILSLVFCMAFSTVAFATDAETETEDEVVTDEVITVKDYIWKVKCPSCKKIGLKYGEKNSFVCQNENCKNEFTVTCPACDKGGFAVNEEGFYVCTNDECIKNPLTLDDLLSNLNLVEEETETETSNKLPMDLGGKNNPLEFNERAEIALQGTATGMIMIFAVLGLLAVIVSLSKLICYDIPNKKKEQAKAAHAPAVSPSVPVEAFQAAPVISEPVTDDGELAAVITAAIAAMLESGEYKNEFVGGFRVVSFKRSTNSAWNRK